MAKDKKKKQVVEEPPPVVEEPPPKTQEEIEDEWYETIKAAQNNEEKMKVILDSLNITDYDGNARTTIYMDFVFYMFKFAEEQSYTNKQIIALYHMVCDVLDQLKTSTEENPITSETSYEYFRSILMPLTLSKENNPPLFTISQSEKIIDYMILSLYQHFLLYYSIFNMEQTNHNQEMNIVVETPFYIPPLSEFHDSSDVFPQQPQQLSRDGSQLSLEQQQQQQQQQQQSMSEQQSQSSLSQGNNTATATTTATNSTANMSVNPSMHEGIGTTSNPPSTVEQTATTTTTDTTTTTTTNTTTTDPSTSTTTTTTDPSTSTTDPSTATEQNTTSSASLPGKSTSTTNLTTSTTDLTSSRTVKE